MDKRPKYKTHLQAEHELKELNKLKGHLERRQNMLTPVHYGLPDLVGIEREDEESDEAFIKRQDDALKDFIETQLWIDKDGQQLPIVLHPKMLKCIADVFYLREDRIIIWGPRGGGKCITKCTPIIKADGEVVTAGEIKIGDRLMGPDGKARTVLSTSKGRGPLYRIDPVKGESWVCNEDHILTLVRRKYKRLRHGGRGGPRERIRLPDEIVDIELRDYLKLSKTAQNDLMQFSVGVDEFEPSDYRPLDIDPYFLGVWFGDGTKFVREMSDGEKGLACVDITNPDPEIRNACQEVANRWGLNLREQKDSKRCPRYRISSEIETGQITRNPLLETLRETVGPEIKIPEAILRGPRKVREEFLAGFLDTDGEMHHNCFHFTQKREDWARGVWWIARSLGLCSTIRTRKSRSQDGYEGTYFVVTISGDIDQIPVRIPRRKPEPRRQIKDATRTGFSVTAIGDGDYYGFLLDGDGRYLLGDFTVTHNSLGTALILWLLMVYRNLSGLDAASTAEQAKEVYNYTKKFWNCVIPGTEIITSRGLIPIEKIKEGDQVLTEDGSFQEVVNVIENYHEGKVHKIKTFGGSNLGFTVTPEHEILTGSGWKKAEHLKKGDNLWFPKPKQIKKEEIVLEDRWTKTLKEDELGYEVPIRKISIEDYSGPVYDLSVANVHSFCTPGAVLHNCFPKLKAGMVQDILMSETRLKNGVTLQCVAAESQIVGKHKPVMIFDESSIIPGSHIFTADGVFPIEEISEDTEVLTRLGWDGGIAKPISHPYNGRAFNITPTGSSLKHSVTEEHRMWAIKVDKTKFDTVNPPPHRNYGKPEWIRAFDLEQGDLLVSPRYHQEEGSRSIDIESETIEFNPDLWRFLGYFCGDGSAYTYKKTRSYVIKIHLGESKEQFIDDVKNLLSEIMDRSPAVYYSPSRSKCRDIVVSHKFWNRWIKESIGNSKNRHVPIELMKCATNEELRQFIIGLFRTDGNFMFRPDGVVAKGNITTTSSKLILNIEYALNRLGIAGTYTTRECWRYEVKIRNRWNVLISAGDLKNLLDPEDKVGFKFPYENYSSRAWCDETWFYSPIRKMEEFHYEGEVYDLSVDPEHSFGTPFCVYHNCTDNKRVERTIRRGMQGAMSEKNSVIILLSTFHVPVGLFQEIWDDADSENSDFKRYRWDIFDAMERCDVGIETATEEDPHALNFCHNECDLTWAEEIKDARGKPIDSEWRGCQGRCRTNINGWQTREKVIKAKRDNHGTEIFSTEWACFAEGALVMTEHGFVPIDKIEPGTLVLTHKGNWKRGYPHSRDYSGEILKIGGRESVLVTPEHPFMQRADQTGSIEWIEAKNFKNRDYIGHYPSLQGAFQNQVVYEKTPMQLIDQINSWSGRVYNLEVEDDESYCIPGAAVHNCERPAWMKPVYAPELIQQSAVPSFPMIVDGHRVVGIDWGQTQCAMVFIVEWHDGVNRGYGVLDTRYMSGLLEEEVISQIQFWQEQFGDEVYVFADASHPYSNKRLQQAGYQVQSVSFQKWKAPGIENLQRWFGSGKLFILDRNIMLLKQLKNIRRDPTDGKVIKNLEAGPRGDHGPDALMCGMLAFDYMKMHGENKELSPDEVILI